MTHKPSNKYLLAAAISACIATPVNTFAQLEEVIVTARQRSESLQDVPAAITAFTEDSIERAGIERAGDFLNLTPGVNLTNTAEVGDTQVSIRGINATRDAEASFAFIQDGILYTNPSSFNREFADIQQIEVLKGPQSAIYGRSAAAGAVIVTTRKPGDEFEGLLKYQIGRDSSHYVQAAAGGALIENSLYGRVSVDYRTTDGLFHNNFLGKDAVTDFENYNVNGRLVWEPNDDLSIDAKFRYGEVIDSGAIAFNVHFAGLSDVNEHEFVFSPNIDPKNEQESMEFSIKLDYDMGWASLTGWMLYSDVDQYFLTDGAFSGLFVGTAEPSCAASLADPAIVNFPVQGTGPLNLTGLGLAPYSPSTCDGTQYQERNQDDISFEIRLQSASDQRLRWLAGFYYLELDREVGVAATQDISALPGGLETTLAIRSFDNALVETLVHDDFETTVWAVFGAFDYDITDDLTASVALRYDEEKRDVSILVAPPSERRSVFVDYTDGIGDPFDDGVAGSPLNPAYVDFANGLILDNVPDRSETYKEVQPKISLSWDVNDQWTMFASWGVGFKSGGFNNTGSQATISTFIDPTLNIRDDYDEEVSNNFEVGFKSTLGDGRVKVEGALYYTDIDDMQFFNFVAGPFGLLRVVSNIDEVTIVGGELGWTAAMTDYLTVSGGASVTNGNIEENTNRPYTVGNEVPYAPRWTFNMALDYARPALPGWDFVGRLDYRVTGRTAMHEVQDESAATPGVPPGAVVADFSRTERDTFELLNLRVALQSDDGKWSFAGLVRNLLDEDYLEEVINAPNAGGSFVHPGTPRYWGLEAAYRF